MKVFSHRVMVIFVLFFFSISSLAGDILYQVEQFSAHTHKLIADDGKNVIYNVFINRVKEYLPTEYGIKNKIIKTVDIGILPGKPLLKLIRHMMVSFDPTVRMGKSKAFFQELAEGKPHTYIISPYHLIFTESTSAPLEEHCKDKLSKHYFISDLAHKVSFAGEFYVHKNPDNGEVIVVFDNASGTYRPDNAELVKLKNLLDANFFDEKLFFFTKRFDQIVDEEKLFRHSDDFLKI